MMAVVLAGGKGTRLKPFTFSIPKPLLPLGDVPILDVVISQLAQAGFTRVVLTLGHMAYLLSASYGSGERFGVKIEYVTEVEPLGTAGSLRMIKDLDGDFLVMNGDILTTINFKDIFEKHVSQRAWGTIAISRREVKIDYGVIEMTEDSMLLDYVEKPTIPYAVSMGINVLSNKCLDFIPPNGKFDMPQLMLAIKKAGEPVQCYDSDCYWQDIGRFDDYQQASADFVADPARFLPDTKGEQC
jgi:NDP-sugar pyrophosphorylase family protein